jgi:hypothetical protein
MCRVTVGRNIVWMWYMELLHCLVCLVISCAPEWKGQAAEDTTLAEHHAVISYNNCGEYNKPCRRGLHNTEP